jgi:hypothetical protein
MKFFMSIVITGAVIFLVAYSVLAAPSKDRQGFEMRQQSSPWAAIIGENG